MENEKLKEEIEKLFVDSQIKDGDYYYVIPDGHYHMLSDNLVKLFEKWHKDEIINNLEEIKHKLS